MKEFFRTLKEVFCVSRNEFFSYGLVPAGAGLLGIIIVLIIMAADGTGEDYGQIGAMFVLMFGAITLFFGGIFSVQSDFNLAISMGKTRKYYLPSRYLLLLAETMMILALAYIVGKVEDALYPTLYPGAVCDFRVSGFLNSPFLFLGIGLVVPVIILLFGVLLMRFSAKFFWILWALWMFGCIGAPRIASAAVHKPDSIPGKLGLALMEFSNGLSPLQISGMFAVVLLAVMVITFALFRKQRVTA